MGCDESGLLAVWFLSFAKLSAVLLSISEIERIQKGEAKKDERETYLDLFTVKNVKLKERVLIPVKQYPKVSRLPTHACPLFGPCLVATGASNGIIGVLCSRHSRIHRQNVEFRPPSVL